MIWGESLIFGIDEGAFLQCILIFGALEFTAEPRCATEHDVIDGSFGMAVRKADAVGGSLALDADYLLCDGGDMDDTA